MEKRKRIKNSFVRRLTWHIMGVMFVVIFLLSIMINWVTSSFFDRVSVLYYDEMATSSSEIINLKLTDIEVEGFNHVADMENVLHSPDSLYAHLRRLVNQNPKIVGAGTAFEPNYYPQKGKWFEPYAYREKDGQVTSFQLGGSEHDYFNMDWYKDAFSTGKAFWSAPYIDKEGAGTKICSFIHPVKDKKGHIIGIFGLDLSLDWLKDEVFKLDVKNLAKLSNYPDPLGKRFYSFIIDLEGTYLSHPDTSYIRQRNILQDAYETPDTLDDHAAKEILNLYIESGYHETVMNGNKVYLFFKKLHDPDWIYVTMVPQLAIKVIGYIVVFILLLLLFASVVVVFFVSRRAIRRISRPLVNFAASTDEIAKGNFTAALPEVHTEDEIGLLHDSFANMQQSLTQYVEELRESTATRASIEKELKIASNIQMSMLPKKFPPYPKRTDIDIYGHMTPAKTVGGDLFDFHISDEKLYFCLGDVSGKGIPASLFMGGAVTLFNSISAHESMPDRIMTQMNDMMVKRNDTFMFVTLFIGVLDLKTGHLDYCNGGHDAPLLFTADGVTRLPVQKNLAVGLMPGMVYEGNEADIVPNSTIFLYTDGLTEAADEHDTLYGPEHLMEEANLALADHQLMPKGLVEFFVDSVNTFVGNAEQSDDLTMLAVRYMK